MTTYKVKEPGKYDIAKGNNNPNPTRVREEKIKPYPSVGPNTEAPAGRQWRVRKGK